jgi:hypothetical protein
MRKTVGLDHRRRQREDLLGFDGFRNGFAHRKSPSSRTTS